MYATAWSLLPFAAVMGLAVAMREVLPALLAGLLLGAFMLHPSPLAGVEAAIRYVLREAGKPDNLRLLVFLYGFGAFVGLVRVTGGVAGFAQAVARRVRTVRGAYALAWVSALFTFMAPDFRILTVAPVLQRIFQRFRVPASEMALIIDITATPLCAVVPVGTAFVGYMVGLLATSSSHHGAAPPDSAYRLLLWSIPCNLFAWLMLGYGLYRSVFHRPLPAAAASAGETAPPADKAAAPAPAARSSLAAPPATRARRGGLRKPSRMLPRPVGVETAAELMPAATQAGSPPDPLEHVAQSARPNPWHLTVPLAVLLALTLFLTWWDGHRRAAGLLGAFAAANAAQAMLTALFITLAGALAWYLGRGEPAWRTVYGFLAGGNEMMPVVLLLVLVWAVSAISADLGFAAFIARAAGRALPPPLVAPLLFAIGCLLSYGIGSSFATWGMLMPLGFSLAATSGVPYALVAGAVFASGTFGGFVSPLSDNTLAMAAVMKLPVLGYARRKLRLALPFAAACAVLYAAAGWLWGGVR
ncbi:hypothetical protein GCM10010885_17140 [Alicyclobacillus cellulosilyticus]|uniref:Na+/H+ antiporter NhaC-like C-terminal domain-containing protein n=1 Tax=Alicyclobacillus cellulosilyticus TaxID=1003997 RepID=A0A917KC43_9BACL|nr:Na+/H+ antiporter NhaC family protein [Alicyclobacillus cellulosilyticus]GGJ08593.1 hypothetical protein GCM10010885_17140 [Alicyclobacillus cellulosilyticus]